MSSIGGANNDMGASAAVPDIHRVLAVLDSFFTAETIPAEDIHVGATAQSLIVSSDGDALFESTTGAVEWHAAEALGSANIIDVLNQEQEADSLILAMKGDTLEGVNIASPQTSTQ